MHIRVKLHGTLRKYLPAGVRDAVELDIGESATVADVIARLGIPPAHARMIISADQQIEPTSALHDGQEVNVFPPMAGGV